MTDKQLIKLCSFWQKELRLQDWNITVEFEDEFHSESQLGETTVSAPWYDATVSIKEGMSAEQTELTLIHELIHIRFGGLQFDESSIQHLWLEQGIEALARLLYKIYRT